MHSSQARSTLTASYACSKSVHALNGDTIGVLLNRQVERYPDRDMIVFHKDKKRLTYSEFKQKVRKIIIFFCILTAVSGM